MGVGGRVVRSEWLRAALVLTLAAVVFLWEPLTTKGMYGPGDIVQQTQLLRVAPADYEPENWVPGDVVYQYQPWLKWNRDELRAGHLPLWNPYNASGVPHLANGQSAVFSPFSVPYYVLPLRAALVAAAFMQVLVGGMLMYGLLRHLRLSFLAALVGGLGFAYCGSSVFWLSWPLSDAAVLVPGMLWGASALVVADDNRRRLLCAAALAVVTAAGLFAGHPETTFFGGLVALALAGARLIALHADRGQTVRRAGWVIGGFALGAGLAAIQLLPFAEYVQHSLVAEITDNPNRQTFFSTQFATLHTLPFAVGSPAHRYSSAHFWPQFVEVGGVYTGAMVLFLAGVAAFVAVRRRQRLPLFFLAVAGVWVLYGYDVAGIGRLVRHVPGFDHAPPWRSAIVWQIAVVVLAAFGVDAVRQAATDISAWSSRRRAALGLGLVGWGTALMAASVWWIGALRDRNPPAAELVDLARRTEHAHIRFVVLTFLVGVVGALALLLARHRALLGVAAVAVAVAVFLQGPFMLRGFNPTVERGYFFSATPASTEIGKIIGNEQTLGVDGTFVYPDINLWYRWRSPGSYDAMWVKSYDDTYRAVLHTSMAEVQDAMFAQVGGGIHPRGLGGFRAMGIRYVTTDARYPFGRYSMLGQGTGGQEGADRVVRHMLVGDGSELNVLVADVPTARTPGGRCAMTLVDLGTGQHLREATAACAWQEAVFSFPSVVTRKGQRLELSVTPLTPDATGPVAAHPLGVAAYATDVPGLELAGRVAGKYRIFAVPGSPGRYFSPGSVTSVDSASKARDRMSEPDFQPVVASLVEADVDDDIASDDEAGTVEVIEETATQVRLRVDRDTPGWLIAQQTRYPGWHATVDGRSVPISTANATFLGVPVGAGESEVMLTFRPASVVVGGVVSVVCAFVLAVGLVGLFLAHWRRADAPGLQAL